MKRNPFLAAALNIILIGLGYVYIGKRIIFGLFLIFGEIFAIACYFAFFRGVDISFLNPLSVTSILLFLSAFGYDAYIEASKTLGEREEPSVSIEE